MQSDWNRKSEYEIKWKAAVDDMLAAGWAGEWNRAGTVAWKYKKVKQNIRKEKEKNEFFFRNKKIRMNKLFVLCFAYK